jgi:hypothetical protein
MRRLTVAVVAIGALCVPSAAVAAGPPFGSLSPRDGASVAITPYSGVKVEFSCPDYFEVASSGTEYKRTWLDYEVVLSPRPFIGEFGGLVVYRSISPSGLEDCSMNIPSYKVEPPGTYYWRVRRTNHEIVGGYEYGEATAFTTFTEAGGPTVPTTPAAPSPPAGPSGGGGVRVSVWTGCGLSAHTPKSSRCGIGGPMGAFIRASREVSYKICVRFPEGENLCTNRPQSAEASTTYVNTITGHTPGKYVVTWIVEGQRYKRIVRRAYG